MADGDTQGFLRDRLGSRPGEIVDSGGAVVGRHDGAYAYTVGQRRGLRLGRPAPDGRPRYVLEVQPVNNTVVVGPADELEVRGLRGSDAVWFTTPSVEWFDCEVQVRAHAVPVAARARALPADDDAARSGLKVELAQALRGVAPGQSVVVYDGTRVIGQATLGHC